jgi:Mannosylglycerate hydrolase MGH1-like glycoside hydrolase domain
VSSSPTAEGARLAAADAGGDQWRAWGPYVSERAWGTVREDYSEDGQAWDFFPHDHARSRAYRWSEDGLAAVCDARQTFCLGLALWNGLDPILKERPFGLTGPQGNHGEDVKDYWWYVDSTPTHSWMTWRYHYPQRAFPYDDLVAENARRGRHDPEYELVDTGVFADDRFWAVQVDYAKAAPRDLLMRVTVHNHGPDEATLHLLPTLWFRNTWAWGLPGQDAVPRIGDVGGVLVAEHAALGTLSLASDGSPDLLFCDNETNTERLYGHRSRSAYPKDGINDHVVHGARTVNPDREGTKAAFHHILTLPPGGSAEVRLRLVADPATNGVEVGTRGFDDVVASRRGEADEFFAALLPVDSSQDEALVLRQAVAGLMWGKQFFHYDVERWLVGDPAGPRPAADRERGRNSSWRHLNNADVISMPDPWEYPWYAAWDLAFHCVPIAHVDPAFAKAQLLLVLREWYMHPNGQVPAYEWSFGDVNPPVHAWAALRVFEIDGSVDHDFLARVFHKLLLNFTWWVNRKDSEGSNVFEGGFLGLDNIGPIDRSAPLPVGARLEQSDGTAWMAMYSLNMLEIALLLAEHDRAYEDLATKFFEHFAYIAEAMSEMGLWDEVDGFFYDVLSFADGSTTALRVRSMVGLIPLCASTTLGADTLQRLPDFTARMRWFLTNKPDFRTVVGETHVRDGRLGRLLSVVDGERLVRILATMLSEDEFLSPHGLRALSRRHRDVPFVVSLGGAAFTVDYEPGESTVELFGGNSNWRGPVWFPVNYLVSEALGRFARFFGDDVLIEHPTGSGRKVTLARLADDLAGRLVSIFTIDDQGRRPVSATSRCFRPTRRGGTWCHFTSTSMATPARDWVPRTRPAGPAWWPISCSGGGCRESNRDPDGDHPPERGASPAPRPQLRAPRNSACQRIPRNHVVWVGLEGDNVLVCTSDWTWEAKDMRRDPRVSMSVVDLANPYRMAGLQGTVVEDRSDEGCRYMDPISVKYTGSPFPSRGADRRCFVIAVQHAAAHTLAFMHQPE